MIEEAKYGRLRVPKSINHQKESFLMQVAYNITEEFSAFSASREKLEEIIQTLMASELSKKEHGDVEAFVQKEGTELLRRLLQGYLDIRAKNETSQLPVTSDGLTLNHVRKNTSRKIASLFGEVNVTRLGYNQRQQSSQFPLDKALNLPSDQYSDGLRKRLTNEAIKISFDNSVKSIDTTPSDPKRPQATPSDPKRPQATPSDLPTKK